LGQGSWRLKAIIPSSAGPAGPSLLLTPLKIRVCGLGRPDALFLKISFAWNTGEIIGGVFNTVSKDETSHAY
jgi:hypothetical protein